MTYYKRESEVLVLSAASSSPGTGWVSTTVQNAMNYARTNGLTLVLLSGIFLTGALTVDTATGGGQKLTMRAAVAGAATLRFTGGSYLFQVNGINDVSVSGVVFDGQNTTIGDSSNQAGLVRFRACSGFAFDGCKVTRSTKTGVVALIGAQGTIADCAIDNCSVGVLVYNSRVEVARNRITACSNNGVYVWREPASGVEYDGSTIIDNIIDDIDTAGGGTGQNGNGIVVYRAVGVKACGNTISNVQYSCIRFNASGAAQILGNHCISARECSVFLEATGPGLNLDGAVIANNIIEQAGSGINVVNLGLYSDGISRRVTISSNHIRGITKNTISDPGYSPTVSIASGILVEGLCVLTGNMIEGAAGFGILLGTNEATYDLLATGNLVHASTTGIGYSNNASAGRISIVGNVVSGATNGSVVPVAFNGVSYYRVGSTDLANTADSQVGNVYVGNNRGY
ncbi:MULTISPECIES: TIGR03808 family TAT-translocated repetitive protein [Alphaproteobacteria]|uniref:Tat protein n=2 Tax=Alphaproteobacteria TaxID=28211 RepID=A0A512HD67_9HYPH|nr:MULTISPECIES: TIGR03808 family TAT-translocated repetitive protein [Alphaproteobacteria]GEO83394.1 Tat protein [Ciceribacter naphthalenivorans]GLR23033.1 Tat protein [Ciceribacter naphthalenivorans]GLT05889.1 Tat protein [Sphingomonas psychrolutea]